jgi:hypothetical protein
MLPILWALPRDSPRKVHFPVFYVKTVTFLLFTLKQFAFILFISKNAYPD